MHTADTLGLESAKLANTHDPKDFQLWLKKQAELAAELNRTAGEQLLQEEGLTQGLRYLIRSYTLTQNYDAGVRLGIIAPLLQNERFVSDSYCMPHIEAPLALEKNITRALCYFTGLNGCVVDTAVANVYLSNALQALDKASGDAVNKEMRGFLYFYTAVMIERGMRSPYDLGAITDYLEKSIRLGYKPAMSYLARVQMDNQQSSPEHVIHLLKSALPCAEAYYVLALLYAETSPAYAYYCVRAGADMGYHLALDLCAEWSYQGFVSLKNASFNCLSYVTAWECWQAYPVRKKSRPTFNDLHDLKRIARDHLSPELRLKELCKFLLLSNTPYSEQPAQFDSALKDLLLKRKEVIIEAVEETLATKNLTQCIDLLTVLTTPTATQGVPGCLLLRGILSKHAIQKSRTDDTSSIKKLKFLLYSHQRLQLIYQNQDDTPARCGFSIGDVHVCLERDDLPALKRVLLAACNIKRPDAECPYISDDGKKYAALDYLRWLKKPNQLALAVLVSMCFSEEVLQLQACKDLQKNLVTVIVGQFGYRGLKEVLFTAMLALLRDSSLFTPEERQRIVAVFTAPVLSEHKTLVTDLIAAFETQVAYDNIGLEASNKALLQLQQTIITQAPALILSCSTAYHSGQLKKCKALDSVPALMVKTDHLTPHEVMNLAWQFLLGLGKPRSVETAVNLLQSVVVDNPQNEEAFIRSQSVLRTLSRIYTQGDLTPPTQALAEHFLFQAIEMCLTYLETFQVTSPVILQSKQTLQKACDEFYRWHPRKASLDAFPEIVNLFEIESLLAVDTVAQFYQRLAEERNVQPRQLTPRESALVNSYLNAPSGLSPRQQYLALYYCIRSHAVGPLIKMVSTIDPQLIPWMFKGQPSTHLLQLALNYQKTMEFLDVRVLLILLSPLDLPHIPEQLQAEFTSPKFIAELERTLERTDLKVQLSAAVLEKFKHLIKILKLGHGTLQVLKELPGVQEEASHEGDDDASEHAAGDVATDQGRDDDSIDESVMLSTTDVDRLVADLSGTVPTNN